MDFFNLCMIDFIYSKNVRESPRMSAIVCRGLFQYFLWTVADIRGLLQTGKSPRESAGHKWTFVDFRGQPKTLASRYILEYVPRYILEYIPTS